MSWQSPWAWLGLLALGLPVLIHLLSRHRARVQPFPTLRFLRASRLAPSRRTTLSDVPLLLLRMGILAAAVAAVAGPVFHTAHRVREWRAVTARVVIVDTSASMGRRTAQGERAVDAAMRTAAQLSGEASAALTVRTAFPASMLRGASAWLSERPGTHEIVIVSDFQAGTLAADDMKSVPADIGVSLRRVDVSGAVDGVLPTGVRATFADGRTDAEWDQRAPPGDNLANVSVLLGDGERAAAHAALHAALIVGGAVRDTVHSVTVVFPRAGGRAALIAGAKPLNAPWMADAVARLRSDPTLAAAAAADSATDAPAGLSVFTVIACTDAGQPVAVAARSDAGGRDALLVLSLASAGSLSSAALLSGVARLRAPRVPLAEMETASIPADSLRQWDRTPAATANPATPGTNSQSDGRWFWMFVLVLLVIETLVRRRASDSAETARAA